MPKSQFASATRMSAATVNVTGPFEFLPSEEDVTTVLGLDVVLIQGAAFAHGTGQIAGAGTSWLVGAHVHAGDFTVGAPAQGFGVAVLVVQSGDSGNSPVYETFTWSETITVT